VATPDAALASEAVPSSTTAIKPIAMAMEAIFATASYNLRLSFFFMTNAHDEDWFLLEIYRPNSVEILACPDKQGKKITTA
jgi:hypothetical protein